jgi:hypothetical protein
MMEQVGNPSGGIGLHEATLAIDQLLGPDEDTQDEAEAQEPEEAQDDAEETEANYEEADDEAEESDPDEEYDNEEVIEQELPDDLVIKVKDDGKELEVTLDELRKGYSRYSDYTRKTQALAEERKSFYGEAEAIRMERAQYAELLPVLKAQLEVQSEAEPDWDNLYNEDPIEAARLERHWNKSRQERTAKLQAINTEQQRVAEEMTREQQRALADIVQSERAKLTDVIPEWKDEGTMQSEAKELREWALTNGFSERDLSALVQATHVSILRKAMMFDKGSKKVEKVKAQPRKVARIVRPGSSGTQVNTRSSDVKKASQRLARTGRVADAAALLDKLI